MEELSGKGVAVLPVLIEDCELPSLLKDRVYADFRRDFNAGLQKLLALFAYSEGLIFFGLVSRPIPS